MKKFIFCLFLLFFIITMLSNVSCKEEEILSSQELVIRAWEAKAAKNFKESIYYAERCIEFYQERASYQQASLKTFPARGKEDQYAVLNDVGTAYYIKGEILMNQKKWDKAKGMFNQVLDKYNFAQSWDPRGWFWKVAEISKVNLEKIAKAAGEQKQ